MSNRRTGLEKGTILDDFGNVVKLPDGAVEVNPVTGAVRAYKPLDDSRIIERNAGCYNCLYSDTGQAYKTAVEQCYRRDVQLLVNQGLTRRTAEQKAGQTRSGLLNKRGIFNICTGGGVTPDGDPVGDFVSSRYLCKKWSGRTGASLARAPGEPLSPTIAEEYDKRGEEVRMMAPSAEEIKEDK